MPGAGDASLALRPERLALMQAHRASIRTRLQQLQAALGVIEYKITTYGGSAAPLNAHNRQSRPSDAEPHAVQEESVDTPTVCPSRRTSWANWAETPARTGRQPQFPRFSATRDSDRMVEMGGIEPPSTAVVICLLRV